MAKEVFDILPPKKLEKRVISSLPPKKIKPKIKYKKTLIFFLLVLIFAILFHLKFSKAEIKIWPETETVSFKARLTVDTNVEKPDFEKSIIPGRVFEAEKIVSGEFSSSGKTLKKAEGIIRLYNAYTTRSETWREGTRFVSEEGKLFKSKDKIFVPGAKIQNGKIVPSYVDVPVIAAEGGSEYNIGPSHFSIYVFRGTPRYTKFYGESFEPMSGGGETPQVTEEDLKKAEDLLIEKAKSESVAVLKGEIPAEFLFSDDTIETKILDTFSLAQPGMEIDKFTFQVRAKASTIAFSKEIVEEFVKKFILSQIEKDKLIYQKSLMLDYSPETFDLDEGKLSLSLDFSTKVYQDIDLSSLKKILIGKSLDEVKIFLMNQPNIIRSDVHFFPFWVRRVPNDIRKIEISYPLID